ncbi:MAG: T9SS type A sorting domain-containing protein [Lentimicrobium sp.]|nr:T9SS type A sorting domain-containing protein [Lentimicrobium sp.]
MEIYSPEGKQVRKNSFISNGKLDLSNLSNGLYLVKITNCEGKVLHVEKVMKQ